MPPLMFLRLFLAFFLMIELRPTLAEELLDPKDAFVAQVRALHAQTLEAQFTIAQGYYLYRDRFRFVVEGVAAGTPIFPKGREKVDENFGRVEVYEGQVRIQLPIERRASGPLTVPLKLTWQGCADGRLCYPPQHQVFRVDLPAPENAPAVAAAPPQAWPEAASDTEDSRLLRALHQNGFWANVALFFVAGLGLALTPCVFPMIPILSGIIAGQGHHASRPRALALSLMYVLGMALTYALAGVTAGLTGTLVSGLMQNAWVISAFAFIFVILAFSMFGFYQLQLPSSLQSKLSEEAGHFANGRGPGVFIMGSLSALIVGPCVAAPLAGALLYIGQTGDAVLGGSALFALALGMGAPLMAVGLSAGTLLPRAGPWMQGVNRAFGVVLLGVALWLVSPLLPPGLVLAGWAVLFIIPAMFLHALDPLPQTAKPAQRLMKGVGILLLLTGAALLAGALSGSRNLWQPLASLYGKPETAPAALPFERIASLPELEARLQRGGRPTMLIFTADWCGDCKRMERDTYADPGVRSQLAGLALLKVDLTHHGEAEAALMNRFGIFGPPAILLFDASCREAVRLNEFQDAAALSGALMRLRTGNPYNGGGTFFRKESP